MGQCYLLDFDPDLRTKGTPGGGSLESTAFPLLGVWKETQR